MKPPTSVLCCLQPPAVTLQRATRALCNMFGPFNFTGRPSLGFPNRRTTVTGPLDLRLQTSMLVLRHGVDDIDAGDTWSTANYSSSRAYIGVSTSTTVPQGPASHCTIQYLRRGTASLAGWPPVAGHT